MAENIHEVALVITPKPGQQPVPPPPEPKDIPERDDAVAPPPPTEDTPPQPLPPPPVTKTGLKAARSVLGALSEDGIDADELKWLQGTHEEKGGESEYSTISRYYEKLAKDAKDPKSKNQYDIISNQARELDEKVNSTKPLTEKDIESLGKDTQLLLLLESKTEGSQKKQGTPAVPKEFEKALKDFQDGKLPSSYQSTPPSKPMSALGKMGFSTAL